VYLMAVGGAAYLVSKAIKKSTVVAFPELGMEAIYEFDIEDMRQRRKNREIEERNRINHRREKEKADVERHRLRNLFNSKTKAFELPFIKDADIDTKAAIRRAGTHELLYFFINDITRKFIEDNKMTYSEYLDYLDDLEDEAD